MYKREGYTEKARAKSWPRWCRGEAEGKEGLTSWKLTEVAHCIIQNRRPFCAQPRLESVQFGLAGGACIGPCLFSLFAFTRHVTSIACTIRESYNMQRPKLLRA